LEVETDLVRGEAATVAHVAGHGLPTPELLAVDPEGAGTGGRPAMLMARLPGRIDLTPRDPADWLQQMADALAAVHALPPAPWTAPPVDPAHVDATEPPPWSTHPHLWDEALAIARSESPAPVFDELVHGDFQHFNLLWSRRRLSGIVDWNAPHGRPLDADLGHCRLNLVILYGTEVADDFLRRYEQASGGRTVDPWWDLRETVIFLPTWAPGIARQVGPRLAVDADAIHRRVDAHLPRLLARLR
jgi:aminoglycoside phosphotransferase (APT) family kinase protein